MNWQRLAACRGADPELFFAPVFVAEEDYDVHPASDEYQEAEADRVATAKSYCAICPVARKCLDEALERREKTGIWGGVDFDAVKKRRAAEKAVRKRRRRRFSEMRDKAAEVDAQKIADWRRRARGVDATDTEREHA